MILKSTIRLHTMFYILTFTHTQAYILTNLQTLTKSTFDHLFNTTAYSPNHQVKLMVKALHPGPLIQTDCFDHVTLVICGNADLFVYF